MSAPQALIAVISILIVAAIAWRVWGRLTHRAPSTELFGLRLEGRGRLLGRTVLEVRSR